MLACSRRGHSETFKCSQMSSNVKRGKRNQIDLVFFRPVTFYIKGCRDQTTFYNGKIVAGAAADCEHVLNLFCRKYTIKLASNQARQ